MQTAENVATSPQAPSDDGIPELARWLRLATPAQRTRVADEAATSVQYMYQLAGGGRTNCNVALAVRLARATQALHDESGGALPVVTVEQLGRMPSAAL